MSSGGQESLWSYELSTSKPKRVQLTRAASSGDSTPSPGTSIRPKIERPSSPIRSLLQTTLAEESSTRENIRIIPVGETSERESRKSISSQPISDRNSKSSEDVQKKRVPAIQVIPSASVTPAEYNTDISQPGSLSSQSHHGSGSASGSRRRARPAWARTLSGGVWLRQQRRRSPEEDTVLDTITSQDTSIKSSHSEHSYFNIKPLKPPERPESPAPISPHQVVVDSPFGIEDHQPAEQPEQPEHTPDTLAEETSRRKSSIDPKRLFSLPTLTFGRRSRQKQEHKARGSIIRLPTIFAQVRTFQSHKSGLRRDHTAANLERVSAILENSYKLPRFRIRTMNRNPPSEASSSAKYDDGQIRVAQPVARTTNAYKNHTQNDVVSATSSLLNLQMGSTPMNSPSEMATYKIKRSPSADTEEFMKIDISTRGGTSYLPSEARRIHTPPLPRDDPLGVSRGFFFDYNAPSSNDSKVVSHQGSNQLSLQTSTDTSTSKQCDKRLSRKNTTKQTLQIIPQRSASVKTANTKAPPTKCSSPRVKTGSEWFDTQLAALDHSPSTVDIATPHHEPETKHRNKKECQQNLSEIKRQEYEAQLDHNIPEHLPSSPLCPRNPKYWRVVKGRGSQFRGCWMHGFGEWEVVPGLKKGGAVMWDGVCL